MTLLAEGSIFAQRYRVGRCIGEGGMGAVFEVVHCETERRLALKVMHPHVLASDDMRARFRQEAKVAAHVDSEHVVDVFDAGIDDATGMPFLVMELLRGEELGKLLQSHGRLSPGEVVSYLHQTSLALDKTHAAHIVHRDLKPENLFLTQREDGSPHVKILDFGIAKFIVEGTARANVTRSIGTPSYMAPEQFRPGMGVTPKTDIYALGMIAYTLLVGEPYWAEESAKNENIFAFAAIAARGPEEPPTRRASRRGVTLPPSFDAWFAEATNNDPAKRFSSASTAILALADALSVPRPGMSIVATVPMSGPPSAVMEAKTPATTSGGLSSTASMEPSEPSRKGSIVAVLGALVLLGAAAGTAALLFANRGQDADHLATPAPTAASVQSTVLSAEAPALTDTREADAGEDADAGDDADAGEDAGEIPVASESVAPRPPSPRPGRPPRVVRPDEGPKTPKEDELYRRD